MSTTSPARPKRCAIYTRKSAVKGLDDDLNSLEVQREICSAYIRSQRHRSWLQVPQSYDDGGKLKRFRLRASSNARHSSSMPHSAICGE